MNIQKLKQAEAAFPTRYSKGFADPGLEPAEDTDAMPQIPGSSISSHIAFGSQLGREAFLIPTLRPLDRPDPGLGWPGTMASPFTPGSAVRGVRKTNVSIRAAFRCVGTFPDLPWPFPDFH